MSRAFCQHFTPFLHELLPDARRFDEAVLWQTYTRVRPNYIRVEADEITYPLHIMLRHDIESALINAELEPDDIPDLWDEKMQAYLGLSTKDNYKDGCLQDIHWTDGAFGYFPSYTLGAVNAAQMFTVIKQQYPDWQAQFAAGSRPGLFTG
jgi:carboxypeptidase Taq